MTDYNSWVPGVEYTPDMNGGGIILAPVFGNILANKRFNTAFEWCAGPAWIGFWLLETGVCKELVAADINEKAVEMVNRTADKHGYNVRSYVSNNLESIPDYERFDLVVSNPPNFCNIQRSHPFGFLRDDLRPSDIGWKIHNNFYDTIKPYLNKGANMYISEIDPYNKSVYFQGELYDSRSEVPMEDFKRMTDRNDLRIEEEIPYRVPGSLETECYVLKITGD